MSKDGTKGNPRRVHRTTGKYDGSQEPANRANGYFSLLSWLTSAKSHKAKFAEIVKSEVQLRRITLPGTSMNKG
jgi:hypothetical protein